MCERRLSRGEGGERKPGEGGKKKKSILAVEKTTVETAVERSVKLGNFSIQYSTRG